MKDKLERLKQYFYERLPFAAKKQVSKMPGSGKQGEIHKFILKNADPRKTDTREIRKIILLHPFSTATRPVSVRFTRHENEPIDSADLEVSFTVMNPIHGEKIEESIRRMFEK